MADRIDETIHIFSMKLCLAIVDFIPFGTLSLSARSIRLNKQSQNEHRTTCRMISYPSRLFRCEEINHILIINIRLTSVRRVEAD